VHKVDGERGDGENVDSGDGHQAEVSVGTDVMCG